MISSLVSISTLIVSPSTTLITLTRLGLIVGVDDIDGIGVKVGMTVGTDVGAIVEDKPWTDPLLDSYAGGVNLTAIRNNKNPIINLTGLLIGFLIIEDGISDKGGRVKIVKRKKLAEVIMLSLI